MNLLRWIIWEKSHLEKEIGKLRSDFYLQSQRINLVEAIGRDIMNELNKLKEAIAANQSSTNAAISRVERKIKAIEDSNINPHELDAMADTLMASTQKLDDLFQENGASTGGITG